MKLLIRLLACLPIFLSPYWNFAQTPEASVDYFEIDERKIVETKWKYAYALHLESNTIIHKAENTYEYFLYFRYNYTYEQFLNGKFSRGNWRLIEEDLHYSFKHINKFTIAAIDKQVMVLEFTQENSRGTYQYHFTRVSTADVPFVKPINELPLVNVEINNPQQTKKKWWAFSKKRKRKKKEAAAPKLPLTYISIEITGGGFYGGIDPVERDYIQIKNDGRLIREFKTAYNGLIVTKKTIPRQELEKFVQSVIDKDFFNMERIYDCESVICQERKTEQPKPIPLRIAIAYGDRRKVITITIFGKDERKIKYVPYPEALDHIIAGIQNMAHRIDTS